MAFTRAVVVIVAALVSVCSAAQLDELFAWNQVEFAWPSSQARDGAIKTEAYVPENNLPLGVAKWQDKLFITVPRWKKGVASSLNYIQLNDTTSTGPATSPVLIPYPAWENNKLPPGHGESKADTIISVFRLRVDACDRLWVMDTGLADILGDPQQFLKPALVVFDLKTDKLIRRIPFKDSDSTENSFFANVIVDVTKDSCDTAFAYVPDLGGYGVVVYDWAGNETWRVKHNFFHFDPLSGDYNVGGVNFQWTDGVFGLALSELNQDRFRTMYFHALSSTKEFSVPTSVLRNKTIATDPHSYFLYKLEGERGPLTQASASYYDEKTKVLFMTQVNRDGLGCWNVKKPLNSQNFHLLASDKERMTFPNDMTIDGDTLYVLSDRMPEFIYKSLNADTVNYRILKIKIADAIANTPCA